MIFFNQKKANSVNAGMGFVTHLLRKLVAEFFQNDAGMLGVGNIRPLYNIILIYGLLHAGCLSAAPASVEYNYEPYSLKNKSIRVALYFLAGFVGAITHFLCTRLIARRKNQKNFAASNGVKPAKGVKE